MNKNTKEYTIIKRPLLFSIGILLSYNVFAAKPSDTYATKVELAHEVSVLENSGTDLQTNINVETSARETADATLQGHINDEASSRATADNVLQGNINAEAVTRGQVDVDLQNQIDQNSLPAIPANRTEPLVLTLCPGSDIPQWGNCSAPYTKFGPGPAGGTVFFLLYDQSTGAYEGYEIAPALSEVEIDVEWGCRGIEITGADRPELGGGKQNTIDIIAGCEELNIAARIADEYSLNGYTDWFLPSQNALYLLRDALDAIYLPGGTWGGYWGSMEYDSDRVWVLNTNESTVELDLKSNVYPVRPIRYFSSE